MPIPSFLLHHYILNIGIFQSGIMYLTYILLFTVFSFSFFMHALMNATLVYPLKTFQYVVIIILTFAHLFDPPSVAEFTMRRWMKSFSLYCDFRVFVFFLSTFHRKTSGVCNLFYTKAETSLSTGNWMENSRYAWE